MVNILQLIQNRMDTGKVVLGILAGAAAGALLGVLFAPAKGSATRRKICRDSENLTDNIKEKFEEFIDNISDKFDKVKKDVSDFAEKAMEKEELIEKDLKTAKH
ncbi:MAG: YtxH domain-containing protein [Bacteroidales bacterium]|nr:YtxH domain-containing protein [Bacteroidales bacterium]